MNAEQLIDQYLAELAPRISQATKQAKKRGYSISKGDTLSGADLLQLKPKQGILVKGRRAVVVDVTSKGDKVELIYVKGAKAFGKEQYLDVKKTDKETPVQFYTKEFEV